MTERDPILVSRDRTPSAASKMRNRIERGTDPAPERSKANTLTNTAICAGGPTPSFDLSNPSDCQCLNDTFLERRQSELRRELRK